jgi:hypothetical protein
MRRIRSYNESLLSEDVKITIRDICLELKDLGFSINYSGLYDKRPSIEINKEYFIYDEVDEIIERIKDYLNDIGYDVKVDLRKNYWRHFIENPPLSSIKLFFTKK